jgi:hypothetical protein
VALALVLCASFDLRGVQWIASGELTTHTVRSESPADPVSLRETRNSFTRIPLLGIPCTDGLTSESLNSERSRTSGTSSIPADCGDVRDKLLGAKGALRRDRVRRGRSIVLQCWEPYTTGGRTDVARSVGESNLASRQPSRQPSSQSSRHTAGVKRLELMACQPAGPICCDSVCPRTHTYVPSREIRYSALPYVSRAGCVCSNLVPPSSCGKSLLRQRQLDDLAF